MFSARCVLLKNVTSGAEEELKKIVDNLQPKCQKSSVKEERMYIVFEDQDTATSALVAQEDFVREDLGCCDASRKYG